MRYIYELAKQAALCAMWTKILDGLSPLSVRETYQVGDETIYRAIYAFANLSIDLCIVDGHDLEEATSLSHFTVYVEMLYEDHGAGASRHFYPMEEDKVGDFLDSTEDDKAPGHDLLAALGDSVTERGIEFIFTNWVPSQIAG